MWCSRTAGSRLVLRRVVMNSTSTRHGDLLRVRKIRIRGEDMALVGADLAQLDNLVKQLSGPMKTELDGVLNKMNQAVQQSSSYWVAQHGDKFRSEFAQFVSKANASLNQLLQEASQVTGKNMQAISQATGNAI